MGIFTKLRNLARYGVITDIDPYDLPPEAFSYGQNCRFRNGTVSRGPVFRDARALTSSNDPRFIFGSIQSSGQDLTFIGHKIGRIYLTTPSAETDYSIAGYVNNNVEAVWSGTHLSNVIYINRADRAPWALLPSGSSFVTLANWNAAWTCGLLRACGGALVALNMTESGVSYPTKIRTSSFATSGAVPTSWDETNPATNATSNLLSAMEGAITDACTLGNSLVIYGPNQSWLMQKSTGFEIFDYSKLPFQKGAINANCSVEVDAVNYVFGPDDIWKHDGISETSIITERVRNFIYGSIDLSQSSKCFIVHNPILKEICFCYVSGDNHTSFSKDSVGGCNRQAVYNYKDDNWTFDDLPSVYFAAYSAVNASSTWANVTGTWDTVGGSWTTYTDAFKRVPIYVGDVAAPYSLVATMYCFDLYGSDSLTTFPVDTNATKGMHLERDGIDLDQVEIAPNQTPNLPDYKLINSIYPLARIDVNAHTTLNLQLGSADYYGQTALFDQGGPQSFDGNTNYKLDFNATGRYLSLLIDYNDYTTCSISGFDVEVDTTGQR